MNARQVLEDMSFGCYFLKASNSTFHDLTQDHALPHMAASLLGMGLKFIPTPGISTKAEDISPSLDCIEWDISLKTFFAGWSDDENYSMLSAKSTWRPPLPPQRIGLRVTFSSRVIEGCSHGGGCEEHHSLAAPHACQIP
jgi:hypothetical protein